MALPEAELLSRYRDWRCFSTLTWSGQTPSAVAQKKLLFSYLYETKYVTGIPFSRLVWCSRHELGEVGGREHYHLLLGSNDWIPTLGQMFQLNQLWDSLPRCGFARHYIFDQSLNGVGYVTKCLTSRSTKDRRAADSYESGKFGHAESQVTLSNSFGRLIGGRRVGVLRH